MDRLNLGSPVCHVGANFELGDSPFRILSRNAMSTPSGTAFDCFRRDAIPVVIRQNCIRSRVITVVLGN
jgi:hypothetical protein